MFCCSSLAACKVSLFSAFVHLSAVHKDAYFYAKIILWEWRISWYFFKIGIVPVGFVINRNVTQRRAFPYLRHDDSLRRVQPMTSQNPRQWLTLFSGVPQNAPCSNRSPALVRPSGDPTISPGTKPGIVVCHIFLTWGIFLCVSGPLTNMSDLCKHDTWIICITNQLRLSSHDMSVFFIDGYQIFS